MSPNYILNNEGEPVATMDVLEWAKWFETADRKIAKDQIGDCRVSTVFLGMDHSFGDGPPLLFETMVFGPPKHPLDEECERYTTRAEALAGHKAMCERVRTTPSALATFWEALRRFLHLGQTETWR